MSRRATLAAIGVAALLVLALAWKLATGGPAPSATAPADSPRATRVARETPSGAAAPASGTATAPLAGVSAAGTVTADGAPFEGARVTAVYVDRARGTVTPASDGEAISGKDGRFVLAKLPAPPFRLRAEASGWRPGWAEVGSFGSALVLEGFELDLHAAGSIAGRITLDGKPVADARVFTGDEQSNDLGGSLEAQSASLADGAYVLQPVRPGRMTVVAFQPDAGYATAVVDVTQGRETHLDLALRALGEASGRVVDPAGQPMAGVSVIAIDAGDHELLPAPEGASKRVLTVGGRSQSALTGADGRFRFRTLTSRNVSFAARVPGYVPAYGHMPAAGESAEIELRLRPDQGR